MVSPLVQALSFQNSVNPAQTGIAPTDVVGSYKLASDVAEKNYQAKLAANNAMFGGLAGLGGAGILAIGGPAAKSLFGTGVSAATPAASAAAPAAGSAALAPTASGTAAAWPSAFGAGATGIGGGGSVAADLGAGGAADAGLGSVAADLGTAGAGAAGAGSVAADLGLDAAGAGVADAAAASMPEWLASILPFLALA